MTDAGALREAYQDVVEIGRGPEGVRFSATTLDGTAVTGLAIAPDVGSRVRAPDRFDAEFQRAASVHHAALVPPVAWGSLSDGTLHCAYARIEAEELTPGSLSPAMVASIGVHVARAVAASHAAGVVHGAISTRSIQLATNRGAQLQDVGLFAALSEGGLGPQAAGALLASPAYTAPEVQSGGGPDAKSDIYGLGAALYELLTGKPPYGGRMTSYVLASVLPEEGGSGPIAEPPSGGSPKSRSNLVVEALVRAIERHPEDRWPSAEAFASALAASVSTGEMAAVSGAKRRVGCLPGAAAVVAAAALLSVLAR